MLKREAKEKDAYEKANKKKAKPLTVSEIIERDKDIIETINSKIDERKMEEIADNYKLDVEAVKQFSSLINSDVKEIMIGNIKFLVQMNFNNLDYMEYAFFQGDKEEKFIKEAELVWKNIIEPKMPFEFFVNELQPSHVFHIVTVIMADFRKTSVQKMSQN
jgi:hypothetical protein